MSNKSAVAEPEVASEVEDRKLVTLNERAEEGRLMPPGFRPPTQRKTLLPRPITYRYIYGGRYVLVSKRQYEELPNGRYREWRTPWITFQDGRYVATTQEEVEKIERRMNKTEVFVEPDDQEAQEKGLSWLFDYKDGKIRFSTRNPELMNAHQRLMAS